MKARNGITVPFDRWIAAVDRFAVLAIPAQSWLFSF
jgi:hypothetical protein